MFLYRCQDTKVTLHTFVIVIMNVCFNRTHKFTLAAKMPAVVHLSLKDAPESFHGPVVNAVGYTGHALHHALFFQFVMEIPVRILEASIAVKQRMGIRIGFYRLVKGLEYQWVVVMLTNNKGYDSSIVKVKNGT